MKSMIKFKFLFAVFFIILFFPVTAFSEIDKTITRALKKIDSDAVDLHIIEEKGQVLVLSRRLLLLVDSAGGSHLSKYRFGAGEFPLRLDVKDIDGDGRLEAMVTSVMYAELSSYLFKIKADNSLELVKNDLPYFFRLADKSGEEILLGQKSSKIEPFAGRVFHLEWNGKKFVRKEKLDIPKQADIYDFTPVNEYSWDAFWVRDKSGYLRRYERDGKKWKSTYKTSERYRGGVNCFLFEKRLIMSERVKEPLCVPTPPSVFSYGAVGEERLVVDSHKFLLGGVILDPSIPQKGYLNVLSYTDVSGIIDCKRYGPYQGWIADYYVKEIRDEAKKGQDKDIIKVFVLRDSSEKRGARVRFSELNITNVDCREEF